MKRLFILLLVLMLSGCGSMTFVTDEYIPYYPYTPNYVIYNYYNSFYRQYNRPHPYLRYYNYTPYNSKPHRGHRNTKPIPNPKIKKETPRNYSKPLNPRPNNSKTYTRPARKK